MFCPVAASCAALAGGVAQNIPPPRKSAPTPLHHRDIFCIERGGRWLIEKRPITGRWAGLWQFITLEREGCATTGPLDSRTLPARGGDAGLAPVSTRLCESIGFVVSPPTPLGQIVHALTHRRYEFNVYRCDAGKNGPRPGARGHQRRWVALDQMAQYPLPRPHVKVCEMLRCASA
jgi:A/G-specific adenine glycosylase